MRSAPSSPASSRALRAAGARDRAQFHRQRVHDHLAERCVVVAGGKGAEREQVGRHERLRVGQRQSAAQLPRRSSSLRSRIDLGDHADHAPRPQRHHDAHARVRAAPPRCRPAAGSPATWRSGAGMATRRIGIGGHARSVWRSVRGASSKGTGVFSTGRSTRRLAIDGAQCLVCRALFVFNERGDSPPVPEQGGRQGAAR
jgi:hypothetical protein